MFSKIEIEQRCSEATIVLFVVQSTIRIDK